MYNHEDLSLYPSVHIEAANPANTCNHISEEDGGE